MMWKNVEEAIAVIERRRHHHSGLELFKKAVAELHDPQDQIQTIHVGGTNGKGSTVNYLRSILQRAGYRVGTFTSPYLISHHDRIRINDISISDEKLLSYINETESLWEKYDLSMFEIDMLIASLYFRDEGADIAIYEVGMGGRFDATNVLQNPLVSVITNIGMDHMMYLGDTYEKIAYEKAGIIKDGVDCISASDREDCLNVFEREADKHHSHLIKIASVDHVHVDDFLYFEYQKQEYQLNTKALYQRLNAALAIETIHYLNEKKNFDISETMIKEGLFDTSWAGRFEIMRQDPLIIIDGAHNLDGIKALVASLQNYDKIHIIFSCLKDKEGEKMLAELRRITQDIVLCEFENERADKAERLAQPFSLKVVEDYRQAIDEGMEKEGVLVICGSLYFISLVRRYLSKKLENN